MHGHPVQTIVWDLAFDPRPSPLTKLYVDGLVHNVKQDEGEAKVMPPIVAEERPCFMPHPHYCPCLL